MAAGLTGGNQTNGQLGGALGSVLALALHANPVIGAGIDLVSGIIGGLFGNKTPGVNEPDVTNTQGYGSTVANLVGTSQANGQYFTESQATSTAFGGLNGVSGVEELLASYGSQSAAPAWLQPMWSELVSMFGVSATGSGSLQSPDPSNIGIKDVTGAAVASGTFSYLQYQQVLAQLQSNSAEFGPLLPVFNVSHLGPDLAQTFLSQIGQYGNGNYIPTGAATGTPVSPGTPVSNTPNTMTLNVTVNGSVVGQGGMSELAQVIQQKIQRNQWSNYNNVNYTVR